MSNETFSAFCNSAEAAGKTRHFRKCTKDFRAEEYAIRDQIVIESTNDTMREKTMLKLCIYECYIYL